jgi:phage FluMu protein Com
MQVGDALLASAPTEQPIDFAETPLLAPRTPVSDVTLVEAPRSTSAAPASAVTPAQAPRSASPPPAPRRGRVPGVPTGYPDFQVLARGDTKIEVQCPKCEHVFRRPNSLMGKLEKCPECRAVMRIPT